MIRTTGGQSGLVCGSNRKSGRKQELFLKDVNMATIKRYFLKGGKQKEREVSEKS